MTTSWRHPPALVAALHARFPGARLGAGYGMSETVGLGTATGGDLCVDRPDSAGRINATADAGPVEQIVIAQEFERLGLAQPTTVIGGWAIPTIVVHGDDAQRERFVAPSLRGEIVWCQLFSEPEAGSDLASLRLKATRVDGGWRLDDQKVWSINAHLANWGICLGRTDPAAPKHRGITYFLVDMSTPGITMRRIREANGS